MTVPPQEEDTLAVYIALRRKRPMLARHLEQTIRVAPQKDGGFRVVGRDISELFPTYQDAAGVRHAAILYELLETERLYG